MANARTAAADSATEVSKRKAQRAKKTKTTKVKKTTTESKAKSVSTVAEDKAIEKVVTGSAKRQNPAALARQPKKSMSHQ